MNPTKQRDVTKGRFPAPQGLYDPALEKDACGVGFVCNINGEKTHLIIRQALEVLKRLAHRGAVGADPATGDGAGLLIQVPDAFCRKACATAGVALPAAGDYGTGIVFLPTDESERAFCKDALAAAVSGAGQHCLGWRRVPVDEAAIGLTARETMPAIEQIFVGRDAATAAGIDFERALYVARKRAENAVRALRLAQKAFFYVTHLSARTMIYKGLLMPHQVEKFFPDLADPAMASALALVHSRYSTNTFPTWDLAQPFRYMAHNGEINTLRGNVNWMRAREGRLESAVFGSAIEDLKPIIVPGGSDSASLDNAYELLLMSGRSLPHTMMMLIPGAWEHNRQMDEKLRDFYRYHACFMEPWDGPAAVAFTDGTRVGAVLDRNGLRPARYLVTKGGFVVMASEVGVLDIPPAEIALSARIEPGRIFFINTQDGRIVSDGEVKQFMANRSPYGEWLREQMVELDALPPAAVLPPPADDLPAAQRAFGYTREDLKYIIRPMAEHGEEPVGAMGNDTPHAVLSRDPSLLFTYFKQLFAQVTNPPIDPIREEIVMSLESYLGAQGNIFEERPEHAHKLRAAHPVLTVEELEKIRAITVNRLRTRTISTLYRPGQETFPEAIERLCREAQEAIAKGCTFVILSDRGVGPEHAALPSLLAVGSLHQCLVGCADRTRIGIVVESGEPREVHHFALLFGYGADLVCPWLAYETVADLHGRGEIGGDARAAVENYIRAVEKGLKKILSKMGISTLQSYRGAQIFEALGLADEVIERAFTGTPSRIGGAGFSVLAEEAAMRHRAAYPERPAGSLALLPSGGLYQYKRDGELHLWNPESIAALQDATRTEDWDRYRAFAELINDQSRRPATLRGLLRFKAAQSIPLDSVESEESIVRRFATGAMSFGSISRGAHETLALAMNRLGGQSNTGEGGEDPARFQPLPNGDSLRSKVKQVASGRFGVTTNYLVNADELQIKMAQGAKPGEGGQLPGHKVSAIIARTRYTTQGVTLISPPPHHDIYSIEDLAQLIFDLKNVNPRARISVKLVSEIGVGTVAAGVAKGHADMILISGGDGGTGASPLSSIKHAGLPWELGLSETHQTLVLNDLRSRVRLQTDGQMRTGRDVAIAALLGAEEYGFCSAVLVVMGCVMLRHCNLNNCSLGIATQDAVLDKRFRGRPEEVMTYMRFVARELREVMAGLGLATVDEMIGRTDLLELDNEHLPWKAAGLDYSRILHRPEVSERVGRRKLREQEHGLDRTLDRKLIELARVALEEERPVRIELPIANFNRATGATLSGEVVRLHGEEGLPEGTIRCRFRGTAGQSFGAWLAKGVTFDLEGVANDYVGKGLSGGVIVIRPDRDADYAARENIIIGNTTLYGATSGEAYIRGRAGERFGIRNSGANAVVEGVGDHGCEYMTGGLVVVLGPVGRNFAAGMSGGIAYVWDPEKRLPELVNPAMVELLQADQEDAATLHRLLLNHHRFTGSVLADGILGDLGQNLARFVKVMPTEYRKVMESMREAEKRMRLSEESDG